MFSGVLPSCIRHFIYLRRDIINVKYTVKVIDVKVKDIINNRKRTLPVLIFLGELAAGFVFSGASMVGDIGIC